MAEAFASEVGKQMLSKVISLAADEVSLAWGFKGELKRLQKRLKMVQALLSDAADNKKAQLESVGKMHCHTSLRKLAIDCCKKLTSVSQLCTSLEELKIRNCPAMVSFPDFRYLQKLSLFYNSAELDYIPWPSSSTSTTCLQHLELKGWPEIKSLPEQLQHLSALRYLSLRSFDGLESLPEWLGNLSSLQSLSISFCKKMMYMPSVEAMRCLTNLSHLEIYNSPLLTQRCIEGSGLEWEKISHITTIEIDGRLMSE
ncbi:hypothetical protein LguiA_029158 [Lonicera macranthoides]